MTIRPPERRWLAVALVVLTLALVAIRPVVADPPPCYFGQPDIHIGAHSINLRPPRSPSELYGHLGGDPNQHAQTHAIRRAVAKRALNLSPQRRQQQDAQHDAQHDKIQTLGYLGDAYNLPLNVSADPAQLLFVQLDTGSSDLWVISSDCTSQDCSNADLLKLDTSQSSSFRPLTIQVTGQSSVNASTVSSQNASQVLRRQADRARQVQVPFSITYDDMSSASGFLATENFTMSDLGVSDQIFGLVNSTNLTLTSQGISGVLGLGFPRGSSISRSLISYQDQLAGAKSSPLVTSILQESNLSYPIFGLSLSRRTGRITFGAVDPEVLPTVQDREQVEWHDVVPFPSGNTALPSNSTINADGETLDAYLAWTLGLSGAGAAGQAASIQPTYAAVGSQPLALLDSGTSSIIGPPAGVQAIFRHIRNSRHVGGGRFVVPCDTQDRMFFSFGGRNFTLLPQDYIIGPAAGQPFLCLAWPAAVAPSNEGTDWVLGTPFLRTVYSLYSIGINGREAPKIGLYPLRQPADSTDPTVIFAPVPTESLSSFLASEATPIATVLPNALVPLPTPSSQPYVFANATSTATLGAPPTIAGAPSTYSPIITASISDEQVPVVASSSTPLPVPSNPADPGPDNAGTTAIPLPAPLGMLCVLLVLVAHYI